MDVMYQVLSEELTVYNFVRVTKTSGKPIVFMLYLPVVTNVRIYIDL